MGSESSALVSWLLSSVLRLQDALLGRCLVSSDQIRVVLDDNFWGNLL